MCFYKLLICPLSLARDRLLLDMPEIRGHEFDVGENYADLEFVGEGAYGIVVRANDRANGNRVGKFSDRPSSSFRNVLSRYQENFPI